MVSSDWRRERSHSEKQEACVGAKLVLQWASTNPTSALDAWENWDHKGPATCVALVITGVRRATLPLGSPQGGVRP